MGFAPEEVIEKTIDNTTQYYLTVECKECEEPNTSNQEYQLEEPNAKMKAYQVTHTSLLSNQVEETLAHSFCW